MTCPNCGGTIIGNGHTTPRHCEFAEPNDYADLEPDAETCFCIFEEDNQNAYYPNGEII